MKKQMKLLIHGGSGNRGCEAIIRGCYETYKDDFDLTVYSAAIKQDIKVGLNDIVELKDGAAHYGKIIGFIKHVEDYISYKYGNGKTQVKNIYKPLLNDVKENEITMVIGGDVYCYGKPYVYYRFNELLKSKFKMFYGCSIEPKSIDDEMKKDLSTYDLIVARESITYDALVENKIGNVYLCPDPAFMMKVKNVNLDNFFDNNVIGINLSPLISNLKDGDVVLKSYIKMIEHILMKTNYKIALIPHVIWDTSNDYEILEELNRHFAKESRITLISGNHSAEELKYIIGKCCMFIGARTHSTIAAYSQCIPTLVIGYSVKARGIAKDLFGTYDNYVYPVQQIQNENDLIAPLEFLISNKDSIKEHLEDIMPEYISKTKDVVEILNNKLKGVNL